MLETKLSLPATAPHSCCTCTRLLSSPSSTTVWRPHSEKPSVVSDRILPCCGRIICAQCIAENARFATYCPFCQLSSAEEGSALPKAGLREPPRYMEEDENAATKHEATKSRAQSELPSYADVEKQEQQHKAGKEDVLHHLHHPRDTIQSLSLSYNIPASTLRTYNKLSSDSLLAARSTILIPSSHYSGPSLSPTPQIEREEDERRKMIRRFMVSCKVAEYEVARLYLEQAGWQMDSAVAAWREDESWEREHPLMPGVGVEGREMGKKGGMRELWKRRFMGGTRDEK